jgi:hypothetical protein
MRDEKWQCINCGAENYVSAEVCSGCKKSCYEIDDEQYILNLIAPPEQRRSDGSNIVHHRKLEGAREAAFAIPVIAIPFVIKVLSQTPENLGFNVDTALFAIDTVIPAILFAVGALLFAIYSWSVVIDHIDRRKNEIVYYDFQNKILKPSLILMAVAFTIKIVVSEVT